MVQNETNMVVADNSGAKSVRIFRLYGGSKRKSSSRKNFDNNGPLIMRDENDDYDPYDDFAANFRLLDPSELQFINAGTYYVCATDAFLLTELSIEICSDVNCTDPQVTATVDNAVICAGNEAAERNIHLQCQNGGQRKGRSLCF